jgi:hypothetical protein
VDLDKLQVAAAERGIDVILLDESLRELERPELRAAKVLKLRYFGGYTGKDVIEALGVSGHGPPQMEFAQS